MKKCIFIITTLLSTASLHANAHDFNSIGNKCDINFEGEVRITNGQIAIQHGESQTLIIEKSGEVHQTGHSLDLNSQQKDIASRYYKQINQAVPQAVSLAEDAVEIANTALTKVFTGFFGDDSQFVKSMNDSILAIEKEVKSAIFPEDGVIVFGKSVFTDGGNVSGTLGKQIEDTVEALISEGMGEIFMALGRSMLNGDGNFSDFEARMEKLGADIESEVETQAASLEHSAKAFCDSLVELDKTETQLQTIEAFKNIDMINVKQRT
ncbi:DUF2884 family protein [Agaribacter flavus]|uniref:DUF2884 family protein n=1 Tax=Agaribacter flavus TaxID=1902781 RepID=A0ABV7FQ17_9ALTE